MEPQEFQQRRLRLGLPVKELARLLDVKEQSLRNFEGMGASRRRPNRQLVRLLAVAEEPGGLALLERVAARSAGAGPATPAPTRPPEETQGTRLATAIVGAILAALKQAQPRAWLAMAPYQHGMLLKRLVWLVDQVLRGENGRALLATRAAINAQMAPVRDRWKKRKKTQKALQSSAT